MPSAGANVLGWFLCLSEDTGGQHCSAVGDLGEPGEQRLLPLRQPSPSTVAFTSPAFTRGRWRNGEGHLTAAYPSRFVMGCLDLLIVAHSWQMAKFPRRSQRMVALLKIGLLAWLSLSSICCYQVDRALCKRGLQKTALSGQTCFFPLSSECSKRKPFPLELDASC